MSDMENKSPVQEEKIPDMSAREMYENMFNLDFLTSEERELIYTATKLYAKGKCRVSAPSGQFDKTSLKIEQHEKFVYWTMASIEEEINLLLESYKTTRRIKESDFRLGCEAVFYRHVAIVGEWTKEYTGPTGTL